MFQHATTSSTTTKTNDTTPLRPRQDSYSSAVHDGMEHYPAFLGDLEQVKAGTQKVVQVKYVSFLAIDKLPSSFDHLQL